MDWTDGNGNFCAGDCPQFWRAATPAEQAAKQGTKQWPAYLADVRSALDATDTTVHRIIEAVALGKTTLTAADVVTFMQYRSSLRAILSEVPPATIPTALPAKPAYPANT